MAAGSQRSIVVISSRSSDEYKKVSESFKSEIASKGIDAAYSEFWYDKVDQKTLTAQKSEILSSSPSMVLVLGTDAAMFVKKNMPEIPSVFAMVVNPRDSGILDQDGKSPEHMAGVSLDVPIDRQFALMKEIDPKIKTVGMMYDADTKVWLKDAAEIAAAKHGLTMVAVGLKPPYDVESALNNELKDVDVLWASIDPKIYNTNTAKAVLLATLRMKIPFMAFTSKYVKAGALIALECNYIGIGKQAAGIAQQMIDGKKPSAIGMQEPIDLESAVNTRTAQIIKLHLPDSVVKLAQQVYGEDK